MGHGEKTGELKKELRLLEVFSIASGAMISSGLFVLPAIAYANTGPAVLLSYLIASLLVIPSLFSKAELSTAMPKAGGDYFFIDRSMGPLMGTIGGFAAWFSLAFKSAFALVGISVFAILLNPGFSQFQMKLIAVFFCIVFTIINIYGVKHSGKTQIIMVMGLLFLLISYILLGIFFVDMDNFTNFAPFGYGSIFSTAGLIFVSFGGLTKICSIAEECKKPGRTIPLGMFLSWSIISILYLLIIFVTIGVTNPFDLRNTLTPITLGADSIPLIAGIGGSVMAVAAILSFITTANAGLLAASRNPMAMGKDQLLPGPFARISKQGTPTLSILFTSSFMIIVILFLDIENLVKTASLLKILLFLFILFSIIIMRESKIRNYRPKFRSPFYPYIQIIGIFGLLFLIIQMGLVPMLLVGCFVLIGFLWYWFYARDKIWREYSLMHVVERLTGGKLTTFMTDQELREILIDRDEIDEQRFKQLINDCTVLDLYKYLPPDELFKAISKKLSKKVQIKEKTLFRLLKSRSTDSNVVIHPGMAIFSTRIRGHNKFEIVLVRTKKGLVISEDIDPIHCIFIILATKDYESFYYHCLMWLVQISEDKEFEKRWIDAKDEQNLRDILLESWKRQEAE